MILCSERRSRTTATDIVNAEAAWQAQPTVEHLRAWVNAEHAAAVPEGDVEDDEDEED